MQSFTRSHIILQAARSYVRDRYARRRVTTKRSGAAARPKCNSLTMRVLYRCQQRASARHWSVNCRVSRRFGSCSQPSPAARAVHPSYPSPSRPHWSWVGGDRNRCSEGIHKLCLTSERLHRKRLLFSKMCLMSDSALRASLDDKTRIQPPCCTLCRSLADSWNEPVPRSLVLVLGYCVVAISWFACRVLRAIRLHVVLTGLCRRCEKRSGPCSRRNYKTTIFTSFDTLLKCPNRVSISLMEYEKGSVTSRSFVFRQ